MRIVRSTFNIFVILMFGFGASLWMPLLFVWQIVRWQCFGDQDLLSTELLSGEKWIFED